MVLALGAAYAGYTRYQKQKAVAADLARFEAAARDLQDISLAMTRTITPEKESHKKDCVKQSREYEKEPLVCNVYYEYLIGADSAQNINTYTDKLRETISASPALQNPTDINLKGRNTAEDSRRFNFSPDSEVQTIGDVFMSTRSKIPCSVTYQTYDSSTPTPPEPNFISINSKSLFVTIFCHDQAKAPIFPLQTS